MNHVHHKKKILVVENDRRTLDQIHKILEHERVDLLESLSAEDALDVLEREEVHLVICNIQMPGMSGTEFLNELHNWDSELPVILTSTESSEKDWEEAMHADAIALISRPIRRELLLKAVHKAIHTREAVASL